MANLSALVLEASINANLEGLRKGLQQGERDLAGFGKGVSPAGLTSFLDGAASKLATLGGRMSALGATISGALTSHVKDAIGAASDLNESISKTEVVFGQSADVVKRFAETSASGLGQSKQQALEAAGTFGNLFTSLKIGQAPAAEMSTSLVKLASDLASFNNLDPTEALEKLRAGITGEAEPLKSLGIAMNETAVKAKAMELGLKPVGKELSEQQKIAARYAIIMEQSGNAQGDFARTSDGLANSQRIFKAQLDDLSATFGQTFLPIITKGVQFLSDLLKRFQELPQGTQQVITVLAGVGAALGPVLSVLGTVASGASAVVGAFSSIASAVGGLTSVFSGAGAAVSSLGAVFSTIIAPIAAIGVAVAALVVAVKDNVGGIRDAFAGLVSDLKAILDKIISFVRAHVEDFRKIWDGLKTFFGGLVSFIGNALSGLIDVIRAILKAIQGDWSGAWELLKSAAGKIVTGIVDLIGSIFKGLVSILAGVWGLVRSGIEAAWAGIASFFTTTVPRLVITVAEFFATLPVKIFTFLANLPSMLLGLFGKLLGLVSPELGNFVQGVADWFGRIPALVFELLGKVWEFIKNGFASAVTWAVEGATNLYNGVSEWIGKLPELFGQIWDNVIDYLKGIPGRIWDAAKSIGSSVWEAVKDGLGVKSPSGPEKEIMKMDKGLQMLLSETAANNAGPAQRVGKAIYDGVKAPLDKLPAEIKKALDEYVKSVSS